MPREVAIWQFLVFKWCKKKNTNTQKGMTISYFVFLKYATLL